MKRIKLESALLFRWYVFKVTQLNVCALYCRLLFFVSGACVCSPCVFSMCVPRACYTAVDNPCHICLYVCVWTWSILSQYICTYVAQLCVCCLTHRNSN